MFATKPDIEFKDSKSVAPATSWPVAVAGDYAGMRETSVMPARLGRPLRVLILGMRGFPNVQGGVEKHTEKLACELAALGCDVRAIVRSCHVAKAQRTWHAITLVRIWAPHVKGLEAFIHTFLGVLYAAINRPEILHIHGIGPAFFTPLARAFGLRVVVTYHSLNYEHKKWGLFARFIFRLGEWAGMKFANDRIAVSGILSKEMNRAYRVTVNHIPNGIDRPLMVQSTKTLEGFGLASNRYALTVARIDEEKRQLDLIEAYARLRTPDFKLALVGDADYSGHYARSVGELVRETPGVVLLGYQTAEALAELYAHASVFVLPSANEGQPIVVLEAASHGLPLILSDIPPHREISIPDARYFAVGDVAALAEHLATIFATPTKRLGAAIRIRLIARHDWHQIAQSTLAIYTRAVLGNENARTAANPAGSEEQTVLLQSRHRLTAVPKGDSID